MGQSKSTTSNDAHIDICKCAVHMGESGVVECLAEGCCKWKIHFRYPIGYANKLCTNPFMKQSAESSVAVHKLRCN